MSDMLLHGGSLQPSPANEGRGNEHLPQLLAKLDPDAERAGLIYEQLRRRLILFFRLKRPHEAEDLADEVLDRVARRLSEGVEMERVEFYSLGVARFVLRERGTATQREERLHLDVAYLQQTQLPDPNEELQAEANVAALRRCLRRLSQVERSMMLTYYGADGAQRIQIRQGMAEKFGISLNALHNRALRLRKQLERCVGTQVSL
jgi:DNA-directed RNA polymerase specialized sigma24 family protein